MSTKILLKLTFIVALFASMQMHAQEKVYNGDPDASFETARNLAFNQQRKQAQDTLLHILTKYPDYHEIRAFLATTYSWDNSAGANASATVSPTNTTTYTVTGTTNGCKNSKAITVTVNAIPTVAVNSATICAGKSVLLNASGATSFNWSNSATTSSISVSPSTTTFTKPCLAALPCM